MYPYYLYIYKLIFKKLKQNKYIMELQAFINTNSDYLSHFKEHKLYVRNYSKLGLSIVKGYRNNKYDYENHPWLRYCRGAIINTKTNRLVCIPPQKAEESKCEDLEKIINDYSEENSYEPLIDGTMINLFYHDDEWMIATRSNIGAKNSWDSKQPFNKMFLEVQGSEWFNELNKEYCYSFVLHHVKNRIITPIEENAIFLIENYHINETTIERKELDRIPNITNIFQLTKNMIKDYQGDLFFPIKGFTIKTKKGRLNWINPNYHYVEILKMNYNNKFLNYIALRQQGLLSEYLTYFPEDSHLFDKYRNEFNQIKIKLYERYVSRFIKKEIETKEIEYPLKPLVYELHGYYKETGEKINIKIVSDYLHSLDGKRILFIKNKL
tara:strand:+ start:22441 stop:23583 length:1143 start_codon:yes stop_codon:yes gene_type:complete